MHLILMVDCFSPSTAGRPMTWFSTRAKVLLACLWALWVGMGSSVSAEEGQGDRSIARTRSATVPRGRVWSGVKRAGCGHDGA